MHKKARARYMQKVNNTCRHMQKVNNANLFVLVEVIFKTTKQMQNTSSNFN